MQIDSTLVELPLKVSSSINQQHLLFEVSVDLTNQVLAYDHHSVLGWVESHGYAILVLNREFDCNIFDIPTLCVNASHLKFVDLSHNARHDVVLHIFYQLYIQPSGHTC